MPQASASAQPSDAIDSDSDSNKRLHDTLIRQANRRKMDALRKRASRYAVKAPENWKLTAALRRAETEAEAASTFELKEDGVVTPDSRRLVRNLTELGMPLYRTRVFAG